jgi:hypothetical protein
MSLIIRVVMFLPQGPSFHFCTSSFVVMASFLDFILIVPVSVGIILWYTAKLALEARLFCVQINLKLVFY